jgi:serine/threonine protein kinase
MSPPAYQQAVAAAAAGGGGSRSGSRGSSGGGHSLFWKRGQEIGHGAYGRVFMAMNKADGHIFAVKMAKFDERDEHEKKYFQALQRELDICKDLRYRHIVSCLGHEYAKGCLYIYLEYVAGGSLRRMLEDFGPLEWSLLRKSTRGLLKGLNYLHTHDPPVVHRDLKGKNILVDLDFCVKLADFGCSKRDAMSASNAIVGSLQFVAPEVMQQKGHGRKGDIWSLGCVVIEMATAADPWGKGAIDNFMQAYKLIGLGQGTPPVPPSLHPVGQDLLGLCLRRSPEDRPSCAELLNHEICSTGSRRDLPPAPPGSSNSSRAALGSSSSSRAGSRTGPRAGGSTFSGMNSRGSSRENGANQVVAL